jgi:hypothetical protein
MGCLHYQSAKQLPGYPGTDEIYMADYNDALPFDVRETYNAYHKCMLYQAAI